MKIILKIKYTIIDIFTMIGRCLLHSIRNLDTLITTIVLPILMLLLFVYVFGGAIDTGFVNYLNYVVPGIILVCIGYGASISAISINNDITKGIIDRFRSMPISKSSVLMGHVFASVIRNTLTTTIVMLMAILMGFQTNAGITGWILVVLVLLLYTFAMTLLSMVFGLIASNPESASAFSFFVLFLPYISSAFVPTKSMPNILREFAENQPITPITETIRSIFSNIPVGNNAIISIFWFMGILIASYFLALLVYKYKIS